MKHGVAVVFVFTTSYADWLLHAYLATWNFTSEVLLNFYITLV